MTMTMIARLLCLVVSLVYLTSGEVTMADDERKEEMGEADAGAGAGTGGSRGRKSAKDRERDVMSGAGFGPAPTASGAPGPGGLGPATGDRGGGGVAPGVSVSPDSTSRGGGAVRRQTLGPRTQAQPQNAADTQEEPTSVRRDAGTTGFAGAQPSGRRKRRSATALTIGPASTTRKTLLGT